ncbi:hypothetical protein PV797_20190 [Clostridiaceae bacterium M8S5]|nr:hypothetical protein PV797_20190 [Clostridiaceae bacterium M8S5]
MITIDHNDNITDILKNELLNMGINNDNIVLNMIREKNGVHVYRVIANDNAYVIKYFSDNQFAREISNYKILNSIKVPTIRLIEHTNKSLLLEDICESSIYRLGITDDLDDCYIARKIAKWYKTLHNQGQHVLNLEDLYCEHNIIKKDSIIRLKDKTSEQDNKVWSLLLDNFNELMNIISSIKLTMTYNDFYWTNLIVRKDKTEALMYDYNLMGKGYRYSDIRNVCTALSPASRKAFLDEYGEFNEDEKIIDDGISILINLMFAYERKCFPVWGKESLKILKSGELYKRLERILNIN